MSEVQELSQRIDAAFVCPHCGGQGWYIIANSHTGEPEQEQCKWCDDKAGILASLASLGARLKKEPIAFQAETLMPRGQLREETGNALCNRGRFYERCEHNPRERAFADAWEKENVPNKGTNYGYGILQDLFCKPDPMWGHSVGGVADFVLSPKEREIAATAIQWLGSNCGWCFLGEVIKECGYELHYAPKANQGAEQKA